MKKLLLLFVGMLLFLVACTDKDASEEKSSNPPNEESGDSQVQEVDTNNEETTDKEEMSKRDALYYLEEITKSSLNISYLTDGDGETEVKQLLTEGIDNIDAAVSEINENFNPEDDLTIEVMKVADFVKVTSEKYLDDNNFEALSNASGEIGYMVGMIAGNYLDEELPPTIARVSEDFSDVDESDKEVTTDNEVDSKTENKTNSGDVNGELKAFIDNFNNYAEFVDGLKLIDINAISEMENQENGFSQIVHSSNNYVFRVSYDENEKLNDYAITIADIESEEAFTATYVIGEVLGVSNEILADALLKVVNENMGSHTLNESGIKVSIFNNLSEEVSESNITVWFSEE